MPSPAQVDPNVPRGKAVFHAILPAIGFGLGGKTGAGIVLLTGLAMAVSVIGGPRFSVIGRIYRGVVRPAFKIAAGPPEAAAPHRFAEAIGAVFLLAAGVFSLVSNTSVGPTLTLVVVALATLNAAAGICVGCQMYVLFRRFASRTTV